MKSAKCVSFKQLDRNQISCALWELVRAWLPTLLHFRILGSEGPLGGGYTLSV